MSPNLSFEYLAIVLALAGTGCSKATPAAESSTVRSDPATATASAVATPTLDNDKDKQTRAPMATPPVVGASAAPGGPRGGASANELRRKAGDMGNPTGQASCGAGSCTSEIKKK